jgi:hypothetical protein
MKFNFLSKVKTAVTNYEGEKTFVLSPEMKWNYTHR